MITPPGVFQYKSVLVHIMLIVVPLPSQFFQQCYVLPWIQAYIACAFIGFICHSSYLFVTCQACQYMCFNVSGCSAALQTQPWCLLVYFWQACVLEFLHQQRHLADSVVSGHLCVATSVSSLLLKPLCTLKLSSIIASRLMGCIQHRGSDLI